MAIDITHRDDLKVVFEMAPIGSPSEIVQAHKSINSRYARELLGALVKGKMLVIDRLATGDIWAKVEGADIDKWLGIEPETKAKSKPRKATKKEQSPCLCGCGELTGSNYRPGHDARHAGQIGREIAAIMNGGHDEEGQIQIDTMLAMLPSDLLVAKARKVAETANAKNLAKVKPEPVLTEGTVKVGKNEMVGRRHPNGLVEYLTLKGDWKTASASASKTFTEEG